MRRVAWHDGWWARAHAWVPSPNANARPGGMAVSMIVVHSISLPPAVYGGGAVQDFFTNQLDHDAHPYFKTLRGVQVSAHFFVRRDGVVTQFVSCDERAWHAGVSQWRGRAGCNDFSVGVELEGLEGEPFEAPQYEALARLTRALRRRYPIDAVVGHEHIAPGRKGDPGGQFDWSQLRRLARAPSRLFAQA